MPPRENDLPVAFLLTAPHRPPPRFGSLLLKRYHYAPVSNLHFLTFCGGVKKKKEPNLSDLALSLCCLGRIRTLTGGTRIRRATITPQGSVARGYFPFASAKLQRFFYSAKFFGTFFQKKFHKRSFGPFSHVFCGTLRALLK